MSLATVRVTEASTAEIRCRTRLPFRFGAVTVTEAPLLQLRLRVEDGRGVGAVGMASDLLVPKWFRKDVERSADDDQDALRASVCTAAARYRDGGARSVFEHWQQVQHDLVENHPPTTPDLLERGFGIALVERALLDACCRLAGVPFAAALGSDLFGRAFARPAPPLARIAVRHTVGRLDPLRAADIPAAERLDDGMPQALDEVLRDHGVRWLKIKIGGGRDDDVQRLAAIGRLLDERGLADVRVTLDGNEQFRDFEQLDAVWRAAGEDPHGRSLLQRVQWVEQPLPRARSVGEPPRWPHGPLVLDEADAQRRTFPDSGYDGVSVKNCKGVLRALLNAEWAASHQGHFQSSEDLTNLPILGVQQDLCTAAVLGLEHSERNGHHYFRGLDHLPQTVTEAALAAHADLYERRGDTARLRIAGGAVAIGSLLQSPGYGCDQRVIDALDRELDWQPVR